MKRDKLLILVTALVLVAAFFFGARWYRAQQESKPAVSVDPRLPPLAREFSPRLGPDNAKVVLTEFYDPECEACRMFYPVVKQVMKEFEGQVQLIVRYMAFHKNSQYAIKVLESARKQGKYWEALQVVFERQPEWATHAKEKPELLPTYMKELGLDMQAFNSSLEDPVILSKLQQDMADGRSINVNRTPTFFVNGRVLIDPNFDTLKAAIQREL